MNKISLDVMFKCEKSEGEDGSSIVKFVADPIVASAPFLNENNFVFSKQTLEKNMLTMNNKPLNFMHNSSYIIGHCQRCTSSTSLSEELISKGAYALKASGTFYKGLNESLYDDIVNSENGFKVSIEARTKDLSWILFDSREGFFNGDFQKVSPEEDPDLHATGKFYLWMFGSVNGLTYKDKMVAVELGGADSEMEFVGLALTDERFGAMAADQNTAFRVQATKKDVSFSTTEFALAVMNLDAEKLEEFGVDFEEASNICEAYKKETSETTEETKEKEETQEFGLTLTQGESIEGIVEHEDDLVALIKSIKDEVVSAISEKENSNAKILELTERIDLLSAELEQVKAECIQKDELVSASKLELEAIVSQFDSLSKDFEKNKEKELELLCTEIDKLRRFELTQTNMCSAESIIKLDLGSMSAEDYSKLKQGFSLSSDENSGKSKKEKIDYWSHLKQK